jgi:hypothetical protein
LSLPLPPPLAEPCSLESLVQGHNWFLNQFVGFLGDLSLSEAVRHERDMSTCREIKFDFAKKDTPFLPRLSLAGKPLMSLYGTEWRERGYGL